MTKEVLMPTVHKLMGQTRATHVFMLLTLIGFFLIATEGNDQDYITIRTLMDDWGIKPQSWVGSDPCANWEGIICNNSRITAISLADMSLKGQLSTVIDLSELQILDLSSNKDLTGPLPASIENLTKLVYLNLVDCRFSGPIPATIGSLKKLSYLSLKNNRFSGPIPPSMGYMSNLTFLDISGNKLTDSIPVSNGTTPGLDMLQNAKHFHFSNNQLSGSIPPQLFSSNMSLIHLLFDRNNFTGSIPSTIGLVKTLTAVRLDRNSLSGPVPSSLSNLSNVAELHLSNNRLTGPVPNLTDMTSLNYVDISNNTFDASDFPNWFSALISVTTLMMENTRLQGQVPRALFSLENLETVRLRNNNLSGSLDIGTTYGSQLHLIDLQKNNITSLGQNNEGSNYTLILVENPICAGSQNNIAKNYCNISPTDSSNSTPPSNCPACSSGQVASPNCICAKPYKQRLVFIFVSFSNLRNLRNSNYSKALEDNLTTSFQSKSLPVASVSLSHPSWDSSSQLELNIEIFPSGNRVCFNRAENSAITSVLSNQTLEGRPKNFGPYSRLPSADPGGSNKALIIGAAIGGSVLLSLLVLVGVYALHQKKRADKTLSDSILLMQRTGISSADGPQLKGARLFSFEELKKCTNGFSEVNNIGSGGYGQVYRGGLPTGQMVAIKRAKRESMQGAPEFKIEVELLSRVHHKNLVSLVGFCLEHGEQMLVYEFVPNGDLRDTLSGKSGIRLDWMRRLNVALGAARGLAYLHEYANPTIIHRDIKSNNILLDKDLEPKVADFGLSKSMAASGMNSETTVKGTLGYLDPEYYMTQKLTEKSDVYSFGVVMLELITGRSPIEKGMYIVRLIRMTMDKTKDLYNLDDILDPFIGLQTELNGLEKFVDLAMSCVEELQDKRPRMGEVVKLLENIIQIAALNATTKNPPSTAASYEEYASQDSKDIYSRDFDYSGVFAFEDRGSSSMT